MLKLDLDMRFKYNVLLHLKYRLSYLNDIGYLNCKNITKIELLHKKTYGCRIYFNCNFKEEFIILTQSILGSDWRKESNTLLNHTLLGMEYSNRLFTGKTYPGGAVKFAKIENVTKKVLPYVISDKRRVNKN